MNRNKAIVHHSVAIDSGGVLLLKFYLFIWFWARPIVVEKVASASLYSRVNWVPIIRAEGKWRSK